MSKRYGIGKPHIECQCDERFTCGYCLRNAPPYLFNGVPITPVQRAPKNDGQEQ